MRPHPRAVTRAVTVLVASLLAVGALAAPASAASPALTSATPAAGSSLKQRPSGVSLVFNQNVATTSTISVAGPTGASACAKSSPGSTSSTTLACNFADFPTPTLPDGTYTVTYRADSTNAEAPTSGSYAFTIDTTVPVAPTGLTFTPTDYLAVSSTLVVSGTSERAGDSVIVVLSNGASVSSTVVAGSGGAFSASFSSTEVRTLDDGTITATARSTDAAGNTSPATTVTTRKDTSRPTVVSTSPPDGGAENSAGFTYDVTASEALGSSSTVTLLTSGFGVVPSTTVVSGSGATTTPTAALTPGSYRARIQLVDLRGNQSDTIERTFTVDDGAPQAPTVSPVPVINKANVAAVPVSGTGEAGATVTVTAGSATATGTVGSGGAWSVTLDATTLAEGPVSLTAVQRDAAGNASPASTPATTTKDTVAPRVTAPTVAPGTVTASGTTATVSGTVDNGATTDGEATSVRVSVDDTNAATAPRVATGTSSTGGAFSVPVDVAALSDGVLTYTIVATDAAGNPSTAVTATNTKNTAQPAAPTVAIAPSPINNANKAAIVVSGTATGTRVDVSLSDGTTVVLGSSAVSQGRYSVTLDSTSLADGPVTARAVALDGVGNQSAVGVATATKDVVAPAAPTGLTAPTFLSTPTVEVRGNAEPGSTVLVTATDSGGFFNQRTTSGSVVVPASGAWTLTLTVSSFAEGTVTITARATDAVGNQGTTSTITRVRDTTGPGQPATLTAAPAVYSASSTTLRVSGTVANADTGATGLTADVTVADSDASTPNLVATGLTVTSGAFGVDFTAAQVATLAEGSLTLSAVVRDAAGNAGTARTANAVKNTAALDLVSTTPVAGATVRTAATVTATYNQDIANASTIVVTNRLGATVAGSRSVSARTITFTPSAALTEANGPYTVTLRGIDATDAADTEDDTFTFRVDAAAPAAPVISSATNPINSGNQDAVVVSGTSAEPGLVVTVSIGTATGTATTGAGGAWSVSGINVTALADGTLSVTARAADAAGNTSPVSAPVTTVKETVRPVVTALTATATSLQQQSTTVTGTRSEAASVVVAVTDGSRTVTGTVPAGTGAFTLQLDLATLGEGPVTVRATATDAVGNVGAAAQTTAARDVTAPTITNLAASGTTRTDDTTTVTGTRSEAATVALSASDGTRTATAVVPSGAGAFSRALDLSGFTPGTVTVTARATDAAGNLGPATTTTLVFVGPASTSSTTLLTSTSPVRYRATLVLRGSVTRPGGGTAVPVRLTATTVGGRVVDLGTVPVAADGTFTTSLRPSVNATYRATYPGDDANTASTSPGRRVDVTAAVSARSRTGRSTVAAVVEGSATTTAGTIVTLVRLNPSGSVTRLATTRVAGGKYSVRVRLPRGTTRLEVRVAASRDNAAGSVRVNARRT